MQTISWLPLVSDQTNDSYVDTIGGYKFTLPGYQAQPEESGVEHSRRKLEEARQGLKSHLPLHLDIESYPCRSEMESWAYRCNCTFQLLQEQGEDDDNESDDDDNDTVGDLLSLRFQYAMRQQGRPIGLGIGWFPIATRRIQKAMQELLDLVNHPSTPPVISRGLTSVTFSSSWNDTPTADCIVTLLYGEPVVEDEWIKEATRVGQKLCLRQLNGRSKKSFFTTNPRHDADSDGTMTSTLRDSIYIDSTTWNVHLPQDDHYSLVHDSIRMIEVQYEKPETAFFHPNALAMKGALHWMLQRLAYIQSQTVGVCNLLEMYCGCGAHTVALGKSGMVQEILAVELDHRLIEACVHNVALNDLQSMVQVCQGDAGTWARRFYKKSSQNYNILLVDPPRAGLDQDVCAMAKKGNFTHFLYISCGHKALLRDLESLADTFEVIHCRQLDLFPRTDSIETLVHLKRKESLCLFNS